LKRTTAPARDIPGVDGCCEDVGLLPLRCLVESGRHHLLVRPGYGIVAV
jgi:hypothetical protein